MRAQSSEDIRYPSSNKIIIGERHHEPQARAYLINGIFAGNFDGYKIAFELDGNTRPVKLAEGSTVLPSRACERYLANLDQGELLACKIFPSIEKRDSRGLEQSAEIARDAGMEVPTNPFSLSDVARAIVVRNLEIRNSSQDGYLSPIMIDFKRPTSAMDGVSWNTQNDERNRHMATQFAYHNQIVLLVGNNHVESIAALLPHMTHIEKIDGSSLGINAEFAQDVKNRLVEKCSEHSIPIENTILELDSSPVPSLGLYSRTPSFPSTSASDQSEKVSEDEKSRRNSGDVADSKMENAGSGDGRKDEVLAILSQVADSLSDLQSEEKSTERY